MCIGMQSSPSYPNVGPRDTSNEPIKSDYELSEENKIKNASIMARNRTPSLMPQEGGSQMDRHFAAINNTRRRQSLIGKSGNASGGTIT